MTDQTSVVVIVVVALGCVAPLAIAVAWALSRVAQALSAITGANHRAENLRRHDDHALLARLVEQIPTERDHRYRLSQLHALERRQQQTIDGKAVRLETVVPHLAEQAAARNTEPPGDEDEGIPAEYAETASDE